MGGIQQCGERHHRAHIQYYVNEGVQRNLEGPLRAERRRAEEDLAVMRAAGVAVEGEITAAAEAARRQAVVAAMAAVAQQLKTSAAEQRSARAEEAGAAAASGSMAGEADADVVMAAPAPYRPYSVDADEPWQTTERRSRGSRDGEDAWLNVTGATHDKPTFGLDRSSRRKLSRHRGFTVQVLSECKKLLQQFTGKRASAAQIRELLSILPAGVVHKLGIETELLDKASAASDTASYALVVDYRKRISDLVSCAKPAGDAKRVVLKVIEPAWAADVAAGNKFFECIANKNCWCNLFKGLTEGDFFVIAVKGTLQVAAVGEVASAPRTKVATRDVLYSMLLSARRGARDAYIGEAETFDFVLFQRVHCPTEPLAARDLLRRIGATMPSQWQGVVHISTDEGVHTRLGELIEPWQSHNNDSYH
jgi:hypothetical protein